MENICSPKYLVINSTILTMNALDITRSHIYGTAQKQGFQRDTLEKVVRLYYVLKDMTEKPLFRDNLALKGGTAINLAYFNLPRLSVDIDMDFTKSGKMSDLLSTRKEIKDNLFDLLLTQGYTINKSGKETHTLDQWIFNYQSIDGNNDHIKVELNYGIRNHILPITEKEIKLDIVSDSGIKVPTLHPYELFATKINALIERTAVRDLFDVYHLTKSNMLLDPEAKEMLKKGIIFYHTIGVEGTPTKDIDLSRIMNVPPSKIKSQLMPLLPSGKKFFPIDDAKDSVTHYLSSVLTLSPTEQKYLENFSKGIYKPELLFSDSLILERIANHPMAIWKIEQIEKAFGTNKELSFGNKEFQEAIKSNDFLKLVKLKNEGFIPSSEAIKSLKDSVPAQTMIAVQKIFNLPLEPSGLEHLKLAQSSKTGIKKDKSNDLNI